MQMSKLEAKYLFSVSCRINKNTRCCQILVALNIKPLIPYVDHHMLLQNRRCRCKTCQLSLFQKLRLKLPPTNQIELRMLVRKGYKNKHSIPSDFIHDGMCC